MSPGWLATRSITAVGAACEGRLSTAETRLTLLMVLPTLVMGSIISLMVEAFHP
jgi:hypothetical protein